MISRAAAAAVAMLILGAAVLAVLMRSQPPALSPPSSVGLDVGTRSRGDAYNPDGSSASESPLPAAPEGWPRTVELGMSATPDGAASVRASAPFGFRYKYLAGGVNTGEGWATWRPNGDYVPAFVEETTTADMRPIFTYYMLAQSGPGSVGGERLGVLTNLADAATMATYYRDLRLFFERVAEVDGPVVLHVEPDLWGFLQQEAVADGASSVEVKVADTAVGDVAGLPDTAAGFAQAIVGLRDRYAPDVLLAYHFSKWSTGIDILYSAPSDETVRRLATRAAAFYRSLDAPFDLAFTDLGDRDAGFEEHQHGDVRLWYEAEDFRRSSVYIGAFVRAAGVRAVLWQLPLGNTRMRAVNNTLNHYQDNKVEWLLDQPERSNIRSFVDAGVLAFLFGGGAGGTTCACDANRDGVTNPAPINGNERESLSADDDGGLFRDLAAAYYQEGAMLLP